MKRSTIKVWVWVHKWASLVCTAFLLMLCLTGLPLIFHDEIDALTSEQPIFGMPGVGSSGTAKGLLPLDAMLARALANRPGEVPLYMAFDNDQPSMTITTGPRPDSPGSDMTIQSFDRSTGELIGAVPEDSVGGIDAVMHFMLELHTDMFLGLPGCCFWGPWARPSWSLLCQAWCFMPRSCANLILARFAPPGARAPSGSIITIFSVLLGWRGCWSSG